ncbi:hypothetical protein HZH66_012131 [Vespula vulgaris]|uniref:Uncharacterized protein n=1 Tax=Vespula vulgaris TaxID=7454 RepID=A0A834JBK2_VESVU|nr:hypothetical protein HZH66_012131 [Vespula vulgaris]
MRTRYGTTTRNRTLFESSLRHRQSRKPNRDVKQFLPKPYPRLFESNLKKKSLQKKDERVNIYNPVLWRRIVRTVTTIDVLSTSIENDTVFDNDFKRATIVDDNDIDIGNNSKLYRHPKLTQEDGNLKKNIDTTINVDNDFYKRIWEIINGSRPTFKIVVPSTRILRETHKDIFKDEQVALSGSEIDDLNLPYNETGSLNEKKKLIAGVPFDEGRPSEEEEKEKEEEEEDEDEFDRYVKIVDTKHVDNRSTFDPSIESKSVKLHNDQKIISNIDEDLSYVVPNRNGYLNENKNSFNLLKIPIKNESKVEIVNYSSSVPIEQFSEKNKSSLIDYDPYNIPYVEIPDYSDEKEESLDEEDRLRAKQRYVLNQSNSTNLSIDAIDEQTNITSDHAPPVEKNNDVNKHQSPSSRLMTTTNVVESSEISSERAKNDLINHQESKKNENNVNDTSEVKKKSNEEGPAMLDIDFDINEYRKPFDLDDFLKNEPFFQKLKNNNNNKRNSKEQLLEDNKNNYSFMTKNPNNDNNNNSDDDDDDDEDPSKDTKDERINDDMISEEKDFLDRYFSKDVIDKLKTNSDEKIREENRRKNIEENKKRTLKTLSSILEKKDRISRFDEEANKDIEDGVKKAPSFYKNYWSLEYELPAMKDIKRNEENMN